MNNVVGKPVTGDNFFGREDDVARLTQMAESEHVLLLAPRRVGKTSLLLEVQRSMPEGGPVTAVYISVGGVRGELEFVRVIIEAAAATTVGESTSCGTMAT